MFSGSALKARAPQDWKPATSNSGLADKPLLGVRFYRLRHHGIGGGAEIILGALNHQLPLDPDRVVKSLQRKPFPVFYVDDLVWGWWRHMDAGAVVGHQEELEN